MSFGAILKAKSAMLQDTQQTNFARTPSQPQKNPETFYRRPLPDCCIPLSSKSGKELFRSALATGGCESFFELAEHFNTQSEPAFCGLGTLSMLLNALSVDPGRVWQGPWRWYHEEMLDCCKRLDVVRKEGVTLGEFCCLAQCNGAKVRAARALPADAAKEELEESMRSFREAVAECCCKKEEEEAGEKHFLVCCYSRAILKQTGSGHFSPIAAYDKISDSILIMDVARFKYPPHWVHLPLMYEAMQSLDDTIHKPRGWVVVGNGHTSGDLIKSKLFDVPTALVESPCPFQSWQLLAGRCKQLQPQDLPLRAQQAVEWIQEAGGASAFLVPQMRPPCFGVTEEDKLLLKEVEDMRNYDKIRSILLAASSPSSSSSSSSSSLLLVRNESPGSSNGGCGCGAPALKRQKVMETAEKQQEEKQREQEDMNADLVPHVIGLPLNSAHAITIIFAAMVKHVSKKEQGSRVTEEGEEEDEEKFSPGLLTEIYSVVSKLEGFAAHM